MQTQAAAALSVQQFRVVARRAWFAWNEPLMCKHLHIIGRCPARSTPINPFGRQEGDKCRVAVPIIGAIDRCRHIDWWESTPSFAWALRPLSIRPQEVHSAVEIGMAANLRPIQLNECECWGQMNECMNGMAPVECLAKAHRKLARCCSHSGPFALSAVWAYNMQIENWWARLSGA